MYSRTNHHGPREDRGEENEVGEGEAHPSTKVDDVAEDEVKIQRL